jgi:hypothetical protein
MNAMRREVHCKARTKAGKPCRAATTDGGLCFFHANPNKASELGRIGGRSKRHVAAESGDPLPTLDNTVAVRDTVARLIDDVYTGKLRPGVATGLAPLMNLLLRAIETASLERRVAELEKLLLKQREILEDYETAGSRAGQRPKGHPSSPNARSR